MSNDRHTFSPQERHSHETPTLTRLQPTQDELRARLFFFFPFSIATITTTTSYSSLSTTTTTTSSSTTSTTTPFLHSHVQEENKRIKVVTGEKLVRHRAAARGPRGSGWSHNRRR
ncbi:hypothetical protein E2C01_056354 [Portunus trituberculatus]|uniref:Uncharacterized protein n=1 Tax=Portunus trituberculatus TaxID=210409 RepID=A0A5B7GQ47_PORTR|nr:hypothetical protein [Portunus trituberculatus]